MSAAADQLSASLEDYLEGIYHIAVDKRAARATDIAARLGVNNSSVTGALRALSERGLVNYVPYDLVTLTPDGERVACDVVRRHRALRDFFVRILGVEESDANAAACGMEHAVPRTIVERLINFVECVEASPQAEREWVERFRVRAAADAASTAGAGFGLDGR